MNRVFLFAVALTYLVSSCVLFSQSAPEEPPQPAPKCHLSILNGISSGPVDIYLGGKLIYPNIPPGQRISGLAWPTEKIDLRVVDKKSGFDKREQVTLGAGGHYILYLFGDFAPMPKPEGAKPTDPPPVRVTAQFLDSKLAAGESPVRVRLFNSLVDKAITVKSPKSGKSWTVQPMEMVVATGLPEDLYLDAALGDSRRGLFLAQTGDAKNLSIVFYPKNGTFGFRAMPEDAVPSP